MVSNFSIGLKLRARMQAKSPKVLVLNTFLLSKGPWELMVKRVPTKRIIETKDILVVSRWDNDFTKTWLTRIYDGWIIIFLQRRETIWWHPSLFFQFYYLTVSIFVFFIQSWPLWSMNTFFRILKNSISSKEKGPYFFFTKLWQTHHFLAIFSKFSIFWKFVETSLS